MEPITLTDEHCPALRWCEWWWCRGACSLPTMPSTLGLHCHTGFRSYGRAALRGVSCLNLVVLCEPHESSHMPCSKDFDKVYEST